MVGRTEASVRKLNVNELKAELSKRNLIVKGKKNELVQRLLKALESEPDEEEEEEVVTEDAEQKECETPETSVAADTPMEAEESTAKEEIKVEAVQEENKVDDIPPHPYADLLSNFKPPTSQLEEREPIKARSLEASSLLLVDTEEHLQQMMDKLKQVTEIAFAVGFIVKNSFRGFISLIQISTRSEDFIVDALALKEKLKVLNEVFLDTNIVKVVNQAANPNNPFSHKIERMQHEFGLYLVNLVDIGIAERLLDPQSGKVFHRAGLAKILEKHCNVTIDIKSTNKVMRHVRPLSDKVIKWCREDTHHLLHLYDVYRNALVAKGNIRELYEECNRFCSTMWHPSKYSLKPDSYKSLLLQFNTNLDAQQMEVFRQIHDWRWGFAEKKDMSIHQVMPNAALAAIAKRVPTTVTAMNQCSANSIGDVSEMITQSMDHLLTIIKRVAKEIPSSTNNPIKISPLKGYQCHCCAKKGHIRKSCPDKDKKCDLCTQQGHIKRACPLKGAIGPMGPMGPLGPMGPIGPMGPVGHMGGMEHMYPMHPLGGMSAMGPMNPMGWMGPMDAVPYAGHLGWGMGDSSTWGMGTNSGGSWKQSQKQRGSARFQPYIRGRGRGRGRGR